jgi:hypothetical protein
VEEPNEGLEQAAVAVNRNEAEVAGVESNVIEHEFQLPEDQSVSSLG